MEMASGQEHEFRKVVSDSCCKSEDEDECLKNSSTCIYFKNTPSQKIKLALLSLLDPQKIQ